MTSLIGQQLQNLQLNENYILVAAIDFGTTYSAYAFSFRSSPNDIKMNKNWGAEVGHTSYKAPTCVMTKPGGSFHSFGYTAENAYSDLDPIDNQFGGPDGYNLYRNFKMTLHKKGARLTSNVASTDGHVTKAIDIFTMAVKYLKNHLLEAIGRAVGSAPKASDIRWVLTVPAIWTDESKGFMRQVALQAGLITDLNSNKLLIALEPEAASVYCRSINIKDFEVCGGRTNEDIKFQVGDKVIVIDAGGGTVDITFHEVVQAAKVKEIAPPSGGPWGGMKVNEEFVNLLERVFSQDVIRRFCAEFPQQWFQLMMYFERAKKSAKPDGRSSVKVPLPYSLEPELKKSAGQTIQSAIQNCGVSGISFTSGFFILHHEIVNGLFQENTRCIIDHIKSQFQKARLDGLKHILLVGGFGECAFVQKACADAFSTHPLLVPMEAQLAVIKGAVLFGHSPCQISSRIAKLTYGLHVNVTFQEGVHDPQRAFQSWSGAKLVRKGFQVLVKKGEEVKAGHIKKYIFQPDHPDNTSEEFEFYQTEKDSVLYIDEPGVSKICTMVLTSSQGPLSSELETLVTFGHTELLVYARDVTKGQEFPLKCCIDFLSG